MKTVKLSDLNLMDVGNTILISGGVWSGNGKTYIALFPNEEVEELELLDMTLEDWEKFICQADMSDTLVQTANGKIVFRKSQISNGNVSKWTTILADIAGKAACR